MAKLIKAKKSKARPIKKLPTFVKVLPYILIVGGIAGFICSAVLTYDNNKIAVNPNYVPSCNLNPIIACGQEIKSLQGNVFHVPNPYIGLVAFTMLFTAGVALVAGGKFKRWFWLALEGGTVLGVIFVHWFFFEAVYRIHALCPYCMGTWVVTIVTFWYLTLYNIQQGHLIVPRKLKPLTDFLTLHHIDVLVLWFLILAGLILKHFWYYYGHYL
jgi:uncharacterized membrane protein